MKNVENLIECLRHLDRTVRMKLAEALVMIGYPAVEPLILVLRNDDADVKEAATLALEKIEDVRAIEPFIQALRDKNINVQIAVKGALEEIKARKPKT